jgi:hypothetical protein
VADPLAVGLLLADVAASAVFCLTYHLTARWWRHPFGVSLMIYQVLMTAVMAFTAWRVLGGHPLPAAAEVARRVLFAAIPIMVIWRTVVMVRVQRKEGRQYDQ